MSEQLSTPTDFFIDPYDQGDGTHLVSISHAKRTHRAPLRISDPKARERFCRDFAAKLAVEPSSLSWLDSELLRHVKSNGKPSPPAVADRGDSWEPADLPGDAVDFEPADFEEQEFIPFEEPTSLITKSDTRTGKPDKLPHIAYAHGQTDSAHAAQFVDHYAKELLHVPPWKEWLSWDGMRWANDDGVGVLQRAKRYGQALWADVGKIAPHVDRDDLAKVVTAIKSANQAPKIKSYLELAAVDERVVCPVAELNSDPLALNVANGTIDLMTGKLRPHNPADRITQLANVAYDPTAVCPEWERTISLIFDGDQELIVYVQRLLGYSITGDTGEHILPIAYGTGCNGKSTIWNVVTDILGEYASLANDDLLLGDKSNHPTEKAALYQKRFVAISEPERNCALRESRVKELTGDRTITARRVCEDFWSFERTHTFWLSTNHLPRIDGTDEGIWRRVKLIPFGVDLRDKVTPILDFDRWLVQNEGRGILAWLVRGHLDYRQHGLDEPASVTAATGRYRDDSDPLADFIAEHCVDDRHGIVLAADLYRTYSDNGGKWSKTAFGKAMAERYQKDRPDSGQFRKKTVYRGLRLRGEWGEPETQETMENTALPIVAHSSPIPLRNLANSIDDTNECGQLWANGQKSPACNHKDPDTFVHRNGHAYCACCDKYLGRLATDVSVHNRRIER